jgi:hypothetical protein
MISCGWRRAGRSANRALVTHHIPSVAATHRSRGNRSTGKAALTFELSTSRKVLRSMPGKARIEGSFAFARAFTSWGHWFEPSAAL